MTLHRIMICAGLASAMLALTQGGAEAVIVCDDNFQVVNGLPIGTLYCREKTLARVARSYGMHVSDEAIRYSESTKAQVCSAIGYDNRVQEICAPFIYNNGGRFRR